MMNSTSADFSLHALEARFEMQRFVLNEPCDIDCGGGADYGYYGNSWDNHGAGEGYVGPYHTATDNSGAMLDDGSYTDGSAGSFPSYNTQSIGQQPDGSCWPTYPCGPPSNVPSGPPSVCRICRC
jgi:hypothetical protein